jgi:hypothetical protein
VASLVEQQATNSSREDPAATHSTAPAANNATIDDKILQMIQAQPLNLESVHRLLDTLKRRQLELELNDQQIRNVLLHDFLERMIEKREGSVKQIQIELELLHQDKQRVLVI